VARLSLGNAILDDVSTLVADTEVNPHLDFVTHTLINKRLNPARAPTVVT